MPQNAPTVTWCRSVCRAAVLGLAVCASAPLGAEPGPGNFILMPPAPAGSRFSVEGRDGLVIEVSCIQRLEPAPNHSRTAIFSLYHPQVGDDLAEVTFRLDSGPAEPQSFGCLFGQCHISQDIDQHGFFGRILRAGRLVVEARVNKFAPLWPLDVVDLGKYRDDLRNLATKCGL